MCSHCRVATHDPLGVAVGLVLVLAAVVALLLVTACAALWEAA